MSRDDTAGIIWLEIARDEIFLMKAGCFICSFVFLWLSVMSQRNPAKLIHMSLGEMIAQSIMIFGCAFISLVFFIIGIFYSQIFRKRSNRQVRDCYHRLWDEFDDINRR